MAGGLIATGVVAHVPRIAIEAKAPAFQRELIAGIKEMGEALRAFAPDLIVLQSAHWVSTFNWYVTGQPVHQGVCVADEAPDLVPGVPYRRRGDPAFAAALVERIKAAGFPAFLNDTPHFTFDYASLVPLLYLDPGAQVPVVTLPSVICSDLEESLAVGRLVEAAAAASDRRTVFLSSCALSHKVVRGPEIWPSEAMQALDRRFIGLALAGDAQGLRRFLPDFSRDAVAEMGGRTISGMIGAMEMLGPAGSLAGRQYGPYTQSSGSGNTNILVTPRAA